MDLETLHRFYPVFFSVSRYFQQTLPRHPLETKRATTVGIQIRGWCKPRTVPAPQARSSYGISSLHFVLLWVQTRAGNGKEGGEIGDWRLANRNGSAGRTSDGHGTPRSGERYRDATFAHNCPERPTSQSRPRYITRRVTHRFTTARSCAMTAASSHNAPSPSSRLRIGARMEPSSAETGSSQTMESG